MLWDRVVIKKVKSKCKSNHSKSKSRMRELSVSIVGESLLLRMLRDIYLYVRRIIMESRRRNSCSNSNSRESSHFRKRMEVKINEKKNNS